MFRDREGFPTGINQYVPGMQHATEVTIHQPTLFVLGKPAASAAGGVASLVPANTIAGTQSYYTWTSDARYGRMLSYTPSGVPGTNNVVDIYGTDYLGQPMVERITGASAASTLIAGVKVFYRVTHARIITAASNPVTFSIGTANGLGLPFKGIVQYVFEDGVAVALTTVAPVLTDPQTATTGDPRGTLTPTNAPNGTREYSVMMLGNPSVNAAGNGGLHGIKHFGG